MVYPKEQRRKLDSPEAFPWGAPGLVCGQRGIPAGAVGKDGCESQGHPTGEQRRESPEVRAERLLALELKWRGWKRKDLEPRRKGDFENQNSQTPATGNDHELGVDSEGGSHGGQRPRS
jgi:hypothetical protein